jgi:hypothetical protein
LLAQFVEAPENLTQIHRGRAGRQGGIEMKYQFTETGENGTPVSHGRHVPLAFTVENVEPRYGDIRVPSELVAH